MLFLKDYILALFPVAFCNGNAFENLKKLDPNVSSFNAMPAKSWLVLPYEMCWKFSS